MAPNPSRVTTKQGIIEGSLDHKKNIVSFRNVPYGVVNERWRPASKPEPWTDIRDCTKQGPVCPQPRGEKRFSRAINAYSQFDMDDNITIFDDKHCLNLNIFVHTDTLKNADTLPAAVIVFIHGGGFRDGANAMDVYDASNFVLQAHNLGRPIVVAVPNYRLNFHGFFSCPVLEEELKADPNLTTDYSRAGGNWGLQDQRMAFEWIKDNIHIFGGQSTNITAVGQSVGAVSINYHMMIPQHRGLFQRAIMQSCAMNSAPAIRAESEGQLYLDFLVEYFDIPKELSDKEKLQRVREIPADLLGQAAESDKLRMFTPYVDGVMVPEDVRSWVHKTEHYDRGVKAMIVGDVKDEGVLFGDALASGKVEGWTRLEEKYCPPNMEAQKKWEALYGPPKTDQEAIHSSIKLVEHTVFTYPDFCALRALSHREDLRVSPDQGQGFELFQFFFDRHIDAVEARGTPLGAHHGVDLVYLFGPDLAIDSVFTEEEKEFSKKLQTAWILFVYGETSVREYFPVRITRSLDDYEHHEQVKEAILFSDQCTIDKAISLRQGRLIIDFWQESESWTRESREKEDRKKGFRSGLLCITQPGENIWS